VENANPSNETDQATWRVLTVIAPKRKTAVLRIRRLGGEGLRRWIPKFVNEPVELAGAPIDLEALGQALEAALQKAHTEGYEPTEFLPFQPTEPAREQGFSAVRNPRMSQLLQPAMQGILVVCRKRE